jgi:hypothetical protein
MWRTVLLLTRRWDSSSHCMDRIWYEVLKPEITTEAEKITAIQWFCQDVGGVVARPNSVDS